jgi:ABC-type transport system substrate-binding protein
MLNISGYDYSRVDILLERSRKTLDKKARLADYLLFQKYLMDDAPVIFLYYPSQTFIVRDGLENFNLDNIIYPSDRFKSVSDWYWK